MRVLITRPAHQAKSLCDAIRQAGATPILFPTIEIIDPPDFTSLNTAIQNLNQASIAIFTSTNAVHKTLPLIQTWPPQVKIMAIGEATAQVLQSFRLTVEAMPETHNSEGLLALPDLQQVSQQTVLIFKGLGGREVLKETLEKRGANVIDVITYQRRMPDINKDWKFGAIDIIISTSCESLQNLVHMAKGIEKSPLIVISERMATFAQQLGFKQPIIVAKQASDAALVTAFIQWRTHV
jgi:uroporphyrinogen-III synthase